MRHHRKIIYITLGLLLCALMSSAVYHVGYTAGQTHAFQSQFSDGELSGPKKDLFKEKLGSVSLQDFWTSWFTLHERFTPSSDAVVKQENEQSRVMYAIAGLAASYNDPYTVFLPKEQARDLRTQVDGEFVGIGVSLMDTNIGPLITEVFPGSPAEKYGLKQGERIFSVDGVSVGKQTVAEITPRIRGKTGEPVLLGVALGEQGVPRQVRVVRDRVVIPTIAAAFTTSVTQVASKIVEKTKTALGAAPEVASADDTRQDTFVISLSTFSNTSVEGFKKQLERFSASEARNLIIDLRGNPGGYLAVAVDLASYFIPQDEKVVTEVSGRTLERVEYPSKGYDLLNAKRNDMQVVVLVDKNSASSSEIFAGALQDYKVATIIGETTFGKGSAQDLVDVGDIGTLKITVARWFTPMGRNFSGHGLLPDVTVEKNNPKYIGSPDAFMARAKDFFRTINVK